MPLNITNKLISKILLQQGLEKVETFIYENKQELDQLKIDGKMKILSALLDNKKYYSLIPKFITDFTFNLDDKKTCKRLAVYLIASRSEDAAIVLLKKMAAKGYIFKEPSVSQSLPSLENTNKSNQYVTELFFIALTNNLLMVVNYFYENNLFVRGATPEIMRYIPSSAMFDAVVCEESTIPVSEYTVNNLYQISENNLIVIFEKWPELFSRFMNELWEISMGEEGYNFKFTGNLFHWAVLTDKFKLATWILGKKPSFTSLQLNDKSITNLILILRSVEMYKLLKDNSLISEHNEVIITFINMFLNGEFFSFYNYLSNPYWEDPSSGKYFLEMLRDTHIPMIDLTEQLLQNQDITLDNLQLHNKPSNLSNIIPLNEIILLVLERNAHALIRLFCNKQGLALLSNDVAANVLLRLSQDDAEAYQILLAEDLPTEVIQLHAQDLLSGLYHPQIDVLVKIRHARSIILEDERLVALIQETIAPQVACLFLDDVTFKTPKLIQLWQVARVLGDQSSQKMISAKLGYTPNVLWPFNPSSDTAYTMSITNSNLADEKSNFYGRGISQANYTNYQRHISAVILIAMLQNNFCLENKKLSVNLVTLGQLRRWIALMSNTPVWIDFGISRERIYNTYVTPLVGIYLPYHQQLITEIIPKYCDGTVLVNLELEPNAFSAAIETRVPDETGELTTISLSSFTKESDRMELVHTHSRYLPLIFHHSELLINNLLQQNFSQEQCPQLFKKVGEIHWWLAQAAYYLRGSASITETIIKALCLYHGVTMNWNSMPDCEALITPCVHDFAENYHTLISDYQLLSPANPISRTLINTGSPIHNEKVESLEKTKTITPTPSKKN